ncbi:PREDICTED: transcription factor MYB39-like [Nelumbo nucifera]|uniref:Transcription factor MYB39-like n=2 Tax=Nelumbo nucifera TaxID=4432 RepID=A0A1U8B0E9_NELNU|nr:PREDICTED: transcription factor MYB39-like [Nelumbo nucifera]DAD41120.1 TPA_asm: hypothetical protein HUJ06_015443 [Nelumbo nucifera]
MGRSPCCDQSGLKKGPWAPEEDEKLLLYIQKHGHSNWRFLPKLAGLNRCGKSCRLRWENYLKPDIKRGKFSPEEEETILNLHFVLGNKWSVMAKHLPGRTDNEIKNFWNTRIKRKLIKMGFDPMTHQPRTDLFSSLSQLLLIPLATPAEACHQLAKLIGCLPQMILMNSTSPIKENPVLSSFEWENPSPNPLGMATSQPVLPVPDSTLFSYSSDLQLPGSIQTPLTNEITQASDVTSFSQEESWLQSPWVPSAASPTHPPHQPPAPAAPLVTETTMTSNTTGDACSSSSYEGEASLFWPELFLDDDSFFPLLL